MPLQGLITKGSKPSLILNPMNTNPNAKRVLIFGDSNTYGSPPTKFGRLGVDERYTGVMQSLLGDEYEIIEEGLSARTMCASDQETKEKGLVGVDYILPCFISHSPIDVLVINLGTNELKERFGLSAMQIRDNLARFCDAVLKKSEQLKERKRISPLFKILIVSPGYIDESLAGDGWKGAGVLSREIGELFKKYSEEKGFAFVDLGSVAEVGEDGLHYTISSHKSIAAVLAEKVKSL